jgi:hypothetical protein
VLAKQGHHVILFEQDNHLFSRASGVNQARLHTGLHYPRSLLTASESLAYYREFRNRFSDAILDFDSIYAISRFNSKTTGEEFERFISRLELPVSSLKVDHYFNPVMVESAFKVEEPTFDASIVRNSLMDELAKYPNFKFFLGHKVTHITKIDLHYVIATSTGAEFEVEGVVLANYAGLASLMNKSFDVPVLPFNYELTELLIGSSNSMAENLGITVMDGPFWSVMPFGKTGRLSLSSVGLTPRYTSSLGANFPCQRMREDCRPDQLKDCNTCYAAPKEQNEHLIQQVKPFMKNGFDFEIEKVIRTVKVTLKNTTVDDARPTLVKKLPGENVWYILSGKVSTIFDLESELN